MHCEGIVRFIAERQPVGISVNFITLEFRTDCGWTSNSVRYSQVSSLYGDLIEKPGLLLTSNITPLPSFDSELIFNFNELHSRIGGGISIALLMGLLMSLGTRRIALAGFDGYEASNKNYFDSGYVLNPDAQSNERIEAQLKTIIERYDCRGVKFITPSRFESLFGAVNQQEGGKDEMKSVHREWGEYKHTLKVCFSGAAAISRGGAAA